MANTFKFGNGEWAVGKETVLAYNDENNNFKPLPFSFDRASSATVVNKDGLIETVGADEPRIDFLNNTKGALLLEPQRTNKITYSIPNSNWAIENGASITENYSVSPDGSQNASRFQIPSGSLARIYTQFTVDANEDSISFYIKSNTGSNFNVAFYLRDAGFGTVRYTDTNIEVTNEWQRVKIENQDLSAASVQVMVLFYNTAGSGDTWDFSLWGVQAEGGSYPTSYIPTSGSAVTRSAETGVDCLLPNETIIDNSTATVYLEFEALVNDASNRWISFEEVGVATDNQFEIRLAAASNLIQIVTRSAGGGQDVTMSATLTDITANNKIAFNYDGLNWKLAVNGSITDTATAARLFNDDIEKIKFSRYTNTNHFYGKVKDLKVYNTALSDSELQALTTI